MEEPASKVVVHVNVGGFVEHGLSVGCHEGERIVGLNIGGSDAEAADRMPAIPTEKLVRVGTTERGKHLVER